MDEERGGVEGPAEGPEGPVAEETVSLGPPVPPGPSRFRRVPMIIAAVVVVAAGAAAAVGFLLLKGSGDVLESMIPRTANVYVTAYLDPAAGQKVNLLRMSREFPDLRDTDTLDRGIDQVLDEALRDSGLTARDVRPWLGSQIAVAVRVADLQPSVAFLIASEDQDAARAALDKLREGPAGGGGGWTERSHGGVDISVGSLAGDPAAYAMVGDTVVLATDPALVEDVIDTSQGNQPSLSSSSNFQRSLGALPSQRLGLAYVDFRPLVPQIKQSAAESGVDVSEVSTGLGQLDALTDLAVTLTAESNGVAMDMSLRLDPSKLDSQTRELLSQQPEQNAVLEFTPKEAFGVLAVNGFRDSIGSLRDQLEAGGGEEFSSFDREVGLTDAIQHFTGDLGLEVGPEATSPFPGGAILLGVDDEEAIGGFLDRLAQVVTREALAGETGGFAIPWEHESYQGTDIAFLRVPDLDLFGVRPAYAVADGMAIAATSPGEVKAVLEAKRSGAGIATAPTFRQAVGSSASAGTLLYVDIQAIASTIRATLDAEEQQAFDAETAPNLRPLKAFVMTGRPGPEGVSVRLFLLIP